MEVAGNVKHLDGLGQATQGANGKGGPGWNDCRATDYGLG